MINSLGSPQKFLREVFEYLDSKGIDCSAYHLDHLCYRLESTHKYLQLKNEFSSEHSLIKESLVNGRPIAVFKISESIVFTEPNAQNGIKRNIEILELPSPKKGANYKEGWEHVEFVIDEPLEKFLKRHAKLQFDLKGLSKTINKEVRLKSEKFSIKFHEKSLLDIIQIEQGKQ